MPSRNLKLLLTLLLLAISGALVWAFLHSGNHLSTRAAPFETTRGLIANDEVYSGYVWGKFHRSQSYAWLTDDTVLAINLNSNNTYQVCRVNLRSTQRSAVAHLERFLNETNRHGTLFTWQSSPNGRWILFASAVNRLAIYTAIRTDEDYARSWTNRFPNSLAVWLSDSQGFIEWSVRGNRWAGRVYRIDVEDTNIVEVPLPASFSDSNQLRGHGGMTILPFEDPTRTKGQIVQVRFDSTNVALTKLSYQLPNRINPADWMSVMAPTGDRLAWLIFFQQKWPHVEWQREFPFVRSETRYLASLWVSGLDGSDLREIGHLGAGEDLRRIAWTPDGRRLSYVYRDTLWTVPVD